MSCSELIVIELKF